MITFSSQGSFKNVERFLDAAKDLNILSVLNQYGKEGVVALANSTPKDSGETANSWYHKVYKTDEGYSIVWGNSNVVEEYPIAIILQYGHVTGTGGIVKGIDYVNPAMRPIFFRIAEHAWKVVTFA
jgi:hypothetical protein